MEKLLSTSRRIGRKGSFPIEGSLPSLFLQEETLPFPLKTAFPLFFCRDGSDTAAIVKTLIDHGANTAAVDKAGNKAAKLAGRANRRKSRELLEAFTP